jgi:hypothetical protein
VRIPIRTCMMVYMVHLTNQMARKAPIPNIDDVLRTNPAIAQQLAQAAMQQQTQSMRSQPPPMVQPQPPPASNPLAGLQSFMSSMVPPPPPQATNVRQQQPLRAVKLPRPNPQPPVAAVAPPPVREMKAPEVDISKLLEQVRSEPAESKKVKISTTPKRSGTPKSTVSFKL